ncbi:DUF6415 family natural product biosynthesis protein [Streptomyces sp. NPDC001404]|uniref:DUF6415 family natural product biosynthesis protein n=1 Tax=Streptomyces sp. NPDC001404 TaxID=3364571 RepID=UPI0036B281DA
MTTTSAPDASTSGHHYVAHVDGPDSTAPIDMEQIRSTIAEALRPCVEGISIPPATFAEITQRLVGHIELLLPIAEAEHRALRPGGGVCNGVSGADLDALRRRLAYERPDPRAYPLNAVLWLAELARGCRSLLDLINASRPERQTLQQKLKAEHPLVLPAMAESDACGRNRPSVEGTAL